MSSLFASIITGTPQSHDDGIDPLHHFEFHMGDRAAFIVHDLRQPLSPATHWIPAGPEEIFTTFLVALANQFPENADIKITKDFVEMADEDPAVIETLRKSALMHPGVAVMATLVPCPELTAQDFATMASEFVTVYLPSSQ